MHHRKYTETLHLDRQARDGHIQKVIKGGVRLLICVTQKHDCILFIHMASIPIETMDVMT